MNNRVLFIYFFTLYSLIIGGIYAKPNTIQLSDSAKVSILTNSPSPQYVYTMFGHTVLRVQDKVNNIDYSFNYGVFDFESPNFMGRFVSGATDYMVVGYNTIYAIEEYKDRGVEIREQILNLSQDEKQKIWNALLVNVQPENRVYRYNFLYDNCATRPRDIIENNIDGIIKYTSTKKNQTYRDLIHQCVDEKPWLRFGIDLIIGADADFIITDRQKDFLPIYLYNAISGAKIERLDGSSVSLVLEDNILSSSTITRTDNMKIPMDYPLIVGIFALIVVVLFSFWIYKKNYNTVSKIFDTLLFIIAGFLGCIIYFLMFHSAHPCVDHNWNFIWLNPLMLLAGLLFFVKPLTKCIYCYHFINFVALTILLLAWVLIPQRLELAFMPYVMILVVRSFMNVFSYRKSQKINKLA